MEILEAYDATGSAHSAAQLAGVDPKTIRQYVAARDAGRPVTGPGRRPRMIDRFLSKIEEWAERSKGKARADVIHDQLTGLGLTGTEAGHSQGGGRSEGGLAVREPACLPAVDQRAA